MQPLEQYSFFSMIFGSGPVVQGVLLLLILLSVWSWAIAIAKILQFRRARLDSETFRQIFRQTKNLARVGDSSQSLSTSPVVQLFRAGYQELSDLLQGDDAARKSLKIESSLGIIERALAHTFLEETSKLEKGITFLATVASSAPFIGLFGTVWGIMNAFHSLGFAKGSTIQAVAPGISEALVATAIGLAAAIPAAIAYNYFAVTVRQFREGMNHFQHEFLSVAKECVSGQGG